MHYKQQVISAIAPQIVVPPPGASQDKLDADIAFAASAFEASQRLIHGEITPEEYLEWIEPRAVDIIPMDSYIEDSIFNLNHAIY